MASAELNEQERRVLSLIVAGKNRTQIAVALDISPQASKALIRSAAAKVAACAESTWNPPPLSAEVTAALGAAKKTKTKR